MKKSKWYEFRQTFFLIGLVIALALSNLAFTYTSYERLVYKVNIPEELESTIIIPQTLWQKPKPKIPKPKNLNPVTPKDVIDLILLDDPLPDNHIEDAPKIIDTLQTSEIGKEEIVAPIAEPKLFKDYSPVFMAQRMPCFMGCEYLVSEAERRSCTSEKLLRYIHQHVKYPSLAREIGLQGTVVARFVVSEIGEVEDIQIIRSVGGGLEEESIRVIKSFPNWSPGKQNGRPVKVIYTFPFRYQLQG